MKLHDFNLVSAAGCIVLMGTAVIDRHSPEMAYVVMPIVFMGFWTSMFVLSWMRVKRHGKLRTSLIVNLIYVGIVAAGGVAVIGMNLQADTSAGGGWNWKMTAYVLQIPFCLVSLIGCFIDICND